MLGFIVFSKYSIDTKQMQTQLIRHGCIQFYDSPTMVLINPFTSASLYRTISVSAEIILHVRLINLNIFFIIFQIVCFMTTMFMHNAFLSVFTWMSIEAIHLYRMIILVFGADRDLKRHYFCIGWGKYYIFWISIILKTLIIRNGKKMKN